MSDADEYNNEGVEKFQLGHYKEAIKSDRENAVFYCNRGIVKDKLGRYQEAISDYDKAIGQKLA